MVIDLVASREHGDGLVDPCGSSGGRRAHEVYFKPGYFFPKGDLVFCDFKVHFVDQSIDLHHLELLLLGN